MARMIRTGLVLLALLLATPALAAGTLDSEPNELTLPFPIVNELCDGDCGDLPPIHCTLTNRQSLALVWDGHLLRII